MKIVLATGASGGHIVPALVTGRLLKQQGHTVIFVGPLSIIETRLQAEGFLVLKFEGKGARTDSLIGLLTSSLSMVKSILAARKILRSISPDVVVGYGGYGGFPTVIAASLRRLPTVVHEQNVIPGRANRCLSWVAQQFAVSFNETKCYFPENKVTITGCPVEGLPTGKNRDTILCELGLDSELPTILVTGGSQGSRKINTVLLEMFQKFPSAGWQVIHLTGRKDFEDIQKVYESLSVKAAVHAFRDDMPALYLAADAVLARAGALTITEIATHQKPAILIPYPGAGAHQQKNAELLTHSGGAEIILDTDLNANTLHEAWTRLLTRVGQGQLYPEFPAQNDAAHQLVKLITA